ncbi:MAG TPA: hypothetical protein VJK50_02375 [Patescibacteria group bacterium]|nr:hypothetical protein [Patescibacteria group bacterium]
MTSATSKTTRVRRRKNRGIAEEARRQSRLAAKYERRQKPNVMREKDIPGWK